MEIKITSRKTIKPSIPTSNDHKTHKLCLFDVFQLNTYFPLILFYRKTNNTQEFSAAQLRKSLSETLTIFYPLAGRRSDCFSIDCNDEGAIFIEASVNFEMEEFLKPPKLEFLNQLLPCEPNKVHPRNEILPQLLVQVNVFKCGGIALGLCNLHTILDACSCSAFVKNWSAICRDLREDIVYPDFSSAASFFPPRNTFGVRSGVLNINSGSEIEVKCTTRRFLFGAKSISDLKASSRLRVMDAPLEAISETEEKTLTNITRYQAVSSFICKHMILAIMEENFNTKNQVVVLHVVDMRRRMGNPFSKHSIGNLLWPALVVYENVNKTTEISDMVRILQEEIGKLTKELFVKLQNDPYFLWSDECAELMLEGRGIENPNSFVFTSWANMGFGEVDFGWGKPLWMAQRGGTEETTPNTIVFMETEEGIEAWVTMAEEHLVILENDMDFLRFALLNPNVANM